MVLGLHEGINLVECFRLMIYKIVHEWNLKRLAFNILSVSVLHTSCEWALPTNR